MIDVVIARYNEEISWLNEGVMRSQTHVFKNFRIFFYNKGGDFNGPKFHHYETLQNIGRESHTYLTHITKNYNSLADKTIFLQGHPFDHCNDNFDNFINAVVENNFDFLPLGAQYGDYKPYRRLAEFTKTCVADPKEHKGLDMKGAMKMVMGKAVQVPKEFVFIPGAQFACSKETLMIHSKSFYEKVLALHLKAPYGLQMQLPYSLERMWPYIFQYEDVYYKNPSL